MRSCIIHSKNCISIALCSAYVEFSQSDYGIVGSMLVTRHYYPFTHESLRLALLVAANGRSVLAPLLSDLVHVPVVALIARFHGARIQFR